MPAQPRIVCITQARMTSTRLPGKVMLPLVDRPLLHYQLDRLKRCRSVAEVAVATVDTPDCDPIARLCEETETPFLRGDEHDVLSRFTECARALRADVVIRVTSDCPLIDPALIDLVVADYLSGNWDFAALDIPASYPRGLDCEIVSMELLAQADEEATATYDREHVMPFIHRQPERFRRFYRAAGGRGGDYRFCVDTPEDLELVSRVATHFADRPDFGWRDVVALLDAHPELAGVNSGVRQKTG